MVGRGPVFSRVRMKNANRSYSLFVISVAFSMVGAFAVGCNDGKTSTNPHLN